MLCLGIESTAHTFSVGIMNDEGTILSLVSDTYKPQTGGLKPVDVVEHHYTVFDTVLNQAISKANIKFTDLDLIAFSQGPGLGPCLRVGAAISRSLSLQLNIPIVGVNHCIAHVEIGRLLCNVVDPVTVYVSGGNTIISAFDSGMYQVFGETLDLAIGNMIDMVARDYGIPHPGGPKIEEIAKLGTNYINLPYIVKGMDLSFSGLYTAIWKQSQKKTNKNNQANLFYSLQETAYSMLAEVSERAIAHTEKNSVLVTGGVAANKRLQEMISYISNEHNIDFHYAGFVQQDELAQYYAKSKLFLFPTKQDPWGVVANEAMASGTPVLTTPFAGIIDDLLIDGENGYVLDIDSTLWSKKATKLLLNKSLWLKFSNNAKESVAEFTFNNAAQGIIDACEYVYVKQ